MKLYIKASSKDEYIPEIIRKIQEKFSVDNEMAKKIYDIYSWDHPYNYQDIDDYVKEIKRNIIRVLDSDDFCGPENYDVYKAVLPKGKLSLGERLNLANTSSDPELLTKLVKDRNYEVKVTAIANENVPSEILVELACDKECGIRAAVAKNINTPIETLMSLINDKSNYVRTNAASNPSLSEDILISLAHRTDLDAGLMHNPNLPEYLSEEIMKRHPNWERD